LRAGSPAGVAGAAGPDDDLAPGPACCVEFWARGCAGGAGRCPTIGAGIISPAGIESGSPATDSAPDDHFAASPHRRVSFSGRRSAESVGGCPTVGGGIISAEIGRAHV